LKGFFEGADDLGAPAMSPFDVLGHAVAGDSRRVAVEQAALQKLGCHDWEATRVGEILHQVPTRGLEVD
jgi:hypothetical protein